MDVKYYVYRIGGGTPVVPHETAEAAFQEAARLAQRAPGAEFVVVRPVGKVRGRVVLETDVEAAYAPPAYAGVHRAMES